MKSKSFILILLITLIIFVSSCNKKDKETGAFIGGTKGVEISFLSTAPPSEFNVGDTIPVSVVLKNKGEKEIVSSEAKVKIYGVHTPTFGLVDGFISNTKRIPAVSEFLKEGGETELKIGDIKYTGEIINFESFPLKAKVCYPYSTKGQINTCITSRKIEDGTSEKACSYTGEKAVAGSVSGGPIQITSFVERIRSADEIWFDINIENKGVGKVYRAQSSCSDTEDSNKASDLSDVVNVKIVPLDVQCNFIDDVSSSGEIRLVDGKKTLTCKKDVSGSSSYKQTVQIDLTYTYVDSTTKEIKIYSTSS